MKCRAERGQIWPEDELDPPKPNPAHCLPPGFLTDKVIELAMEAGEARSLLTSCRQQLPDCALRREIEQWFRRWPL